MFNKIEVCDLVQIDLARVRKIRAELVAPEAVQGLAETFSALGDPTRVRISMRCRMASCASAISPRCSA